MNLVIDLNKLEEYMAKEGISKCELARRMDINDGHLVKVLSGIKNPGIKFVQGMIGIGYKTTEIFVKKKCQKELKDEDISQFICDYMNTMSLPHNKEYKLNDINYIKSAIELERNDRIKLGISINGNTIEGRKKLNERLAEICNIKFNTNFTCKDVQLYKKSAQLEAKERNLINSMEEELKG